ncbi:G-protein coupled receptor 126 [Trichoplax sp. H2]|nr:G-protein coupled receptor 126 [Trichoplax sp. H2]|eukprot:RDD39088.1 G-protein coupled receptor 126 [Trichoplax sp. H2]
MNYSTKADQLYTYKGIKESQNMSALRKMIAILLLVLLGLTSAGATNSPIKRLYWNCSLVIKNLEFNSLRETGNFDISPQLTKDIQKTIVKLFSGDSANHTVLKLESTRNLPYCQTLDELPSSVQNSSPRTNLRNCSGVLEIISILQTQYYVNTGLRHINFKRIWNQAMNKGHIGQLQLVPRLCKLSQSTYPKHPAINHYEKLRKVRSVTGYNYAIRLITEICSGLSLASILISFIYWRSKCKIQIGEGKFMIINLYVAMAVVCSLQYGVQRATNNEILCKIISILVYLFMFSKILWMATTTVYAYFELLKASSDIKFVNITKWRLLAVTIAYGVPTLVTGISVAASKAQIYGRNYAGFCWMNPYHASWFFTYPMYCFIGFILIIALLFLFRLRRLFKIGHSNDIPRFLKMIIILMIILSLTWLTLALTNIRYPESARRFFGILYIVSISCQGLTLPGFIFFISRIKDPQNEAVALNNIVSQTQMF